MSFCANASQIKTYFRILARVHLAVTNDDCQGEDHILSQFQEFWDLLELEEKFKDVALEGFKKGWHRNE